ncbi:putative spermidine/putrescine transport system substrate-binding protein [Caloramator fervidus]|uniref:Putative spermidine/putrescine transport system substrate-binding protein n=1 Tax=Caloramator fervidus TaxID=29344 RepID=A0A1H5T868_9CLOT|nr:ABC transporter substrate-binding protein [Caloramator fervidus]SEF59015.1 putative spermidine/putrescine transport system substrate-binding protein [Caloramator fervidus]
MKLRILGFLIILSMVFNIGCSKKVEEDISNKTWDEILKLANGTKVTFYGWGGDENINRWLDNVVAKELKEKYNITLERVPMLPDEYLPKLLNEKQAGTKGTIDIVWINGENFYNAKKQGLLYGPFTDKLPNFNKYINKNSPDVKYDFGYPIEGYEAPYGKAQMVFIGDTAKLDYLPRNHLELLELAKKYKGKITYPDVSDFTGSAFVRNIIYDIVGYEKFINLEPDKEKVRKTIQPALDYLLELKPYLWREGKTYPSTLAQLDNMFADGEVYITMNYTPFHVVTKIKEGSFPKTAKSFIFDKGTIGNTHFLAIPFNAPNKAGALVVINHILSPQIQASKYNPEVWGDLPVIEPDLLNDKEKELFKNVDLGEGVIPQDMLLKHRVPEMRADLIPIIESLWREVVLGNGKNN